jgi:hypothetical protein
MFTTPFTDIPKKVTLQNFTMQKQLLESGYLVPAATEDAKRNITPGELVIDLSILPAYRRERIWAACNNAHGGEALKIK